MRISLRSKFVYFSIPKTASEAIRSFLDPYSGVKIVTFKHTTESDPFFSHMLPLEVRKEFDKRGWSFTDFFRFATARNPWARCASLYMMTQRSKTFEKMDFPSWLSSFDPENIEGDKYMSKWFPHDALPMSRFLADEKGHLMVDKVYRLEDQLDELSRDLSLQIGAEKVTSKISLINASPTAYDWKELYGPSECEYVEKIYKSDIDAFGYSFPG